MLIPGPQLVTDLEPTTNSTKKFQETFTPQSQVGQTEPRPSAPPQKRQKKDNKKGQKDRKTNNAKRRGRKT
jgi:hypothetical protein